MSSNRYLVLTHDQSITGNSSHNTTRTPESPVGSREGFLSKEDGSSNLGSYVLTP